MNKLYIFKGDDTGGTFGRTLVFKIDVGEGISLDGCRADFTFDGITKTFPAPIVAGEAREIFYSHNETALMELGTRFASFRIIDAAGKIRTFDNTIRVCVTNDVGAVYPGSTDTATITIGAGISWDLITGKPALVKSVNGNLPDASGNVQIEAGGGKATTLKLDATGKKVFNGEVEITTYQALYNIVIGGNCVLLGTVAASMKDAFYYPHLCDQTAIRFDATGTLGNDVDTRSVAITPKTTGSGYNVALGNLTELATKYDLRDIETTAMNAVNIANEALPKIADTTSTALVYASAFDGAQDNQAIIRSFRFSASFFKNKMKVTRLRIRGAVNDSGIWDKQCRIGLQNASSQSVTIPVNDYADVNLGATIETNVDVVGFFIKENFGIANVRVALVSVDPSLGLSVELSNGSVRNDLFPLVELYGVIEERDASIVASYEVKAKLAAFKELPTNATQAQMIAKVNEIINVLKK